jgi:hypothetical protein
MNVQMRLITADNIEQLTKLGERKVEIEEERPKIKSKNENNAEFFKELHLPNDTNMYHVENTAEDKIQIVTEDWKETDIDDFLDKLDITQSEISSYLDKFSKVGKGNNFQEELEMIGSELSEDDYDYETCSEDDDDDDDDEGEHEDEDEEIENDK